MVTIQATVFFDQRYWVATFERTDKSGYAIAKHIFGAEPTDAEVHAFISEHYETLKFGTPKEFELRIKRMNPKRLARQVRKQMQKIKQEAKPSTFAQDYMREEIEKKKKEKKGLTHKKRQLEKEKQFALKQDKKKQRKKGH